MRENPKTTLSIYGVAQLAKQAFEHGDDFAPSSIIDRQPLASTTDLNSSSVERLEELLPAEKDMDELNDTFEDTSSNRPETERTVLTAPCPANEDVNDCNSFALAPVCKDVRHRNRMFVVWPTSFLVTFCRYQKPQKKDKITAKRKGRSLNRNFRKK